MLVETIGEIQSGKYNLDANSCKHLLRDSYAAILQSVLAGLPKKINKKYAIESSSFGGMGHTIGCNEVIGEVREMLTAAIAELKEAA